MREAHEIVSALGMKPHPEGGWYVEIHRSLQRVEVTPREHDPGIDANAGTGGGVTAARASRAAMTSIYYLLERGQRSHWHRVDADELWAWHAGAPMELSIAHAGDCDSSRAHEPRLSAEGSARAVAVHRLGIALADGERPQAIVPAHAWQSAQPLGDWSLIGCVVAPGFEFAHFEIAPPGWSP
jgi:predicted cupin superfamily sugar epimerase